VAQGGHDEATVVCVTVTHHALSRARERFGLKHRKAKGRIAAVIRKGICGQAPGDALSFHHAGITAIVKGDCVLTVRPTSRKEL